MRNSSSSDSAEHILLMIMWTVVGTLLSSWIWALCWSTSTDEMIKRGFYVYKNTIYVVEPMKTVE